MVRGVDIARNDAGDGVALFWGHGLCSSREQEDRTAMFDWHRLADRSRIIRWDARGHGESDGTTNADDYRWDNLARDLIALADDLGIERFVAGGVSMGAATALHVAAQVPDRVLALLLVLPPTAYATRAAQAEEYLNGAQLVEEMGPATYVQRMNAQPVPEILGPVANQYRFVPAVSEHLLPAVLRGAAASDLPSEQAVRSISAPTLVLAWETDPGHPLSTAERLADLLPSATLRVARRLREVGSWTNEIESFLGAVSDRART